MQSYRVHVERTDAYHARATVREFVFRLGARRADPTAGFNPVETLLAALGDCLLTALDFVAELSKILITGAWIELEATRQDKPQTKPDTLYVAPLQRSSEGTDGALGRLG